MTVTESNCCIAKSSFEKKKVVLQRYIHSTQKSEWAWIDLTFLNAGTYQLPTLFLCSHVLLLHYKLFSGCKGIIGYLANHLYAFPLMAIQSLIQYQPTRPRIVHELRLGQNEQSAYLCTLKSIQCPSPSHIRTEVYLDVRGGYEWQSVWLCIQIGIDMIKMPVTSCQWVLEHWKGPLDES